MCRHGSHGRLRGKVSRAAVGLIEDGSAGLRELLPPQVVQRAVEAEQVRFRQCLFTPLVTLWTFLTQVLSADGSCRQAVAKLLALLSAGANSADADDGGGDVDAGTGPYCKARQRLPEGLICRLAREAGGQLHQRYPSGRLLGGRRVKVVDGTTCSMPDTAANQRQWRQPPTQKPGLGFPLVRLVAVLSLNCAAVLDVATGPYKGKQSGESALFRTLLDNLEVGDVLLADRYYASYWMIALLRERGVDALFRQHQLRTIDFRRGRWLGHEDHVITMDRPAQRPEWMEAATYGRMPATLTVRELRLRVCQRGFRVRNLMLVTTLLDAQLYNKQELAGAFRLRWHVELDLRAIKQTMNMGVLRCKSPAMVLKEIWTHLLAYNLVRTLMARAADRAGVEPRELSFAGAVQAVNAFAPVLQLADGADQERLLKILLRILACHRVGDRPDRYEPRAVKRRAKPIALLTAPRDQIRERLTTRALAKS
jgi:Transposase DDE domain